MCTLSWRRNAEEYELFFNRDELKVRQPAAPPQLHYCEGVRYLAPTDGDFGGTWIFVNEYGLAGCILNRYRDMTLDINKPQYISRGVLLSSLASADRQEKIKVFLENKNLKDYRPFTLVTFKMGCPIWKWVWNGASLDFDNCTDDTKPITSSSYQSIQVEEARIQCFKAMLKREKKVNALFLQNYHHSCISDNGPYSVCMQRDDAETQSLCCIHVSIKSIRLRYAPKVPGQPRFVAMKEWSLSVASSP